MTTSINNNKTSIPRLFDIKQESERIHNCLSDFRSNHTPDQQHIKGSKTLVLLQLKSELKSLLEEGYTSQQIAQVISKSGFSILPKTITQILNDTPKQKKKTSKKSKSPPVKTVIKVDKKQLSASQPAPNLKVSQLSNYEDVE